MLVNLGMYSIGICKLFKNTMKNLEKIYLVKVNSELPNDVVNWLLIIELTKIKHTHSFFIVQKGQQQPLPLDHGTQPWHQHPPLIT